MLALQALLSCCLARLGWTELCRKPAMLGGVIRGTEDPLCYLGQRRHSLAATRPRTHEDQLADESGCLQRDLLRDHAADREAEHIRLCQTDRSDESDPVGAHLFERGRD